MRDINRTVRSLGFDIQRIDHLGSGHLRVVTNVGAVVLGSTPSDRRSMYKFKSEIKRLAR